MVWQPRDDGLVERYMVSSLSLSCLIALTYNCTWYVMKKKDYFVIQ